MSAADTSGLTALNDEFAAVVAKIVPALAAAVSNSASLDQLKAENATLQSQVTSLQADLVASQQAITDAEAKYKASLDALTAAGASV